MRWKTAAISSVVVVLALAGCSGGAEGPPGLTASPTPVETPTPTPTPTSRPEHGVALDLSDSELGIVFEDVPDLEGDAADVHNWIATYRMEYWRTLTSNQPSPAFDAIASADVQASMDQIAAANAAEELRFDGTFHVAISNITVDGDAARGTTCDDYRDVTIASPTGPRTLEEEGADVPVLLEITLARHPDAVGVWMIQTSEWIGAC